MKRVMYMLSAAAFCVAFSSTEGMQSPQGEMPQGQKTVLSPTEVNPKTEGEEPIANGRLKSLNREVLIEAVNKGDIETVKLFKGSPIIDDSIMIDNPTMQWGKTPLTFAIANGNKDMMRTMVADCGSDVNKPDDHNVTPILQALFKGDEYTLGFLHQHGADIKGNLVSAVRFMVNSVLDGEDVTEREKTGKSLGLLFSYCDSKTVTDALIYGIQYASRRRTMSQLDDIALMLVNLAKEKVDLEYYNEDINSGYSHLTLLEQAENWKLKNTKKYIAVPKK